VSERPLGGGGSREWLVPVKPDGRVDVDTPTGGDIVGTHTGFYVGMNAHNPRPDHEYEWLNRDPNLLLIARQKGFQIVRRGDDDAPACMVGMDALEDDSDQPTPLDTSDTPYGDLVFGRIPSDRYRQIHQENSDRAAAMMGDRQVQDFIERGQVTGEQSGGSNPRGLRTRFAMNSHSTQYKDGSGQTVDQWVPPRGTTERG